MGDNAELIARLMAEIDEAALVESGDEVPHELCRLAAAALRESAQREARHIAMIREAQTALGDLLRVIETDGLIPESVSYMRQARAAANKIAGDA